MFDHSPCFFVGNVFAGKNDFYFILFLFFPISNAKNRLRLFDFHLITRESICIIAKINLNEKTMVARSFYLAVIVPLVEII